MQALTLRSPWPWAIASLPAEIAKPVENRGWPAPRRLIGQDIAIHAGKGHDGVVFPLTEANRLYLAACRRKDPAVAVRGAVVAVVTIAGCHLDASEPLCGSRICSPWAIEGEHHWVLGNVRTLATPVPCGGHQKLWTLPDDVESAVRAQLAATEVTHLSPCEGHGLMPCCGKTPFEVPRYHRMTEDPDLVTCAQSARNSELESTDGN